MPLDIQPLSPARRATMLVVMLVLLGASLGFAQLLVSLRKVAGPVYQVSFQVPPGMTEPVPAWEAMSGCVLTGSGQFGSFGRRFAAFSYDADVPSDPASKEAEARDLLEQLLGGRGALQDGESAVAVGAMVSNVPGVQIVTQSGKGPETTFAMVRLVTMPSHVVAICYSGNGGLTEADMAIFDRFCTRLTTIRRSSAKSVK